MRRQYDLLLCDKAQEAPEEAVLVCPGTVQFGDYLIQCTRATELVNTKECFTVAIQGSLTVRGRCSGDELRLSGGTKSLKKLFIDRKVPAHLRPFAPVLADENGVVGVYGIGADLNHMAHQLPAWQICIRNNNGLPEEKENVE